MINKKFHIIYKITCVITQRFYIGMHSTDNLEDGYLGSGKRLCHSLNKHGKENHIKEIIEFLPNRISLKHREEELINEELLCDPLCMNLKKGGEGGGKLWNDEHAKNFHAAGGKKVFQLLGKRHVYKLKNDTEYRKKYSKSMSISQSGQKNGFYGRKHSEETKEKMRLSKRMK